MTSQKLVLCKMGVQGDCQNFRKYWENGLEGRNWLGMGPFLSQPVNLLKITAHKNGKIVRKCFSLSKSPNLSSNQGWCHLRGLVGPGPSTFWHQQGKDYTSAPTIFGKNGPKCLKPIYWAPYTQNNDAIPEMYILRDR